MGHLSEDTPEALAARYSKWDTAELVRAVELEADGYRPEALELMRRELDQRGAGVQLRTSAREAEVENDRRLYVGVGGWLVFFVAITALGSAVTLRSFAADLLTPLPLPAQALLLYEGLVGLYGLVVIGMIFLRYRETPRHAKILLGLIWLAAAVRVLLSLEFAGPAFFLFVVRSIWITIWWAYFSVSKRVRMTFRPESEWYDPCPAPPPPRETSSPASSSPPALSP